VSFKDLSKSYFIFLRGLKHLRNEYLDIDFEHRTPLPKGKQASIKKVSGVLCWVNNNSSNSTWAVEE
jgi:hypothetical protein